jgi:hypothetical protein
MKAQLIVLGAAGLLLASSVHAAPRSDVQQFLDAAHRQGVERLQEAGVALGGQGVSVQGRVEGSGRLSSVHVVKSSGSLDTDARATAALRRLNAASVAPPVLSGRDITLTFADAPIVQAKAP